MKDNLATLPNWKKGASAYERLSELALLAREKPEKFERFVVVYEEKKPTGNSVVRTMEYGADLASCGGLLHLGADNIIEESKK